MSQSTDRKMVAYELADTVAEFRLDTGPVGGYDGQSDNEPGKPHIVLLSRPATLDGIIKVYSDKFIHIKWQQGKKMKSALLKTLENAKEFLRLLFVEKDEDAAMELAEVA